MNEDIKEYVEKYNNEIKSLFYEIRELIAKSIPSKVEEKLWAKIPSFYVGERFVRVIPFKDHINVEASAIIEHKSQLEQYNITPKGMLQIYLNQDIPYIALQTVFIQTLIN